MKQKSDLNVHFNPTCRVNLATQLPIDNHSDNGCQAIITNACWRGGHNDILGTLQVYHRGMNTYDRHLVVTVRTHTVLKVGAWHHSGFKRTPDGAAPRGGKLTKGRCHLAVQLTSSWDIVQALCNCV